MMIPKNIENKEIGLLGLGVSGKSAFKSLKAGGGNIYAYDDNISNDPIVIAVSYTHLTLPTTPYV